MPIPESYKRPMTARDIARQMSDERSAQMPRALVAQPDQPTVTVQRPHGYGRPETGVAAVVSTRSRATETANSPFKKPEAFGKQFSDEYSRAHGPYQEAPRPPRITHQPAFEGQAYSR